MSAQALDHAEGEIAAALQRLTTGGGQGNFMIVTAGEVYVQFAAALGEKTVYCEAVSDEYLPAHRRLSLAQINELKDRGFAPGAGGNYSSTFDLAGLEDARKLARSTVEILERVYGCSRDTQVEIKLTLE